MFDMLIYCLFSGKDTYLVSLFANAAGIMSEIVIGMEIVRVAAF